jgi:hypothetical protein
MPSDAADTDGDDEWEEYDHPTHHRPLMIQCGALAALNLAAWFLLIAPHPKWVGWFAAAFFAQLAAAIAFGAWYCRTARCPECAALLQREQRPWGGRANRFPCPACRVVWVSRIVGP